MTILAAVWLSFSPLRETVSYETLAKPLNEILREVGRLTGEDLSCSDDLKEDRIVVRATNVQPDDLVARIAQADAAKIVEVNGVKNLIPDDGYDGSLLGARRSAIEPWHADWTKKLSAPAMLIDVQADLSALSTFVSPDLLRAQPLEGISVYSRPAAPGGRELPSWFPDFTRLFQDRQIKFAGERVSIASSKTHVLVSLTLLTREGAPLGGYSAIMAMPRSDKDLHFEEAFLRSPLSKRFLFAEKLPNLTIQASFLPTDGLPDLKAHEWGNEPLNALAGPMLLEAARGAGLNLAAAVEDYLACPSVLATDAAYFLSGDFVKRDGDWVVASPIDPVRSRRSRTDRRLLTGLVSRARALGYFEAWDQIDTASKPGGPTPDVLRLEAASISALALATVSSFDASDFFSQLHSNSTVWEGLVAGGSAPVRSMPSNCIAALRGYLSLGNPVIVRTSTNTADANGVVHSSYKTEYVQPSKLGLDKAIPAEALIQLTSDKSTLLLGDNPDRSYAVLCPVIRLASGVAHAEVSKGTSDSDAVALLKRFIPLTMSRYQVLIVMGDVSVAGPTLSFIQPSGDVSPRALQDLPKSIVDEYERTLKQQRDSVKNGG